MIIWGGVVECVGDCPSTGKGAGARIHSEHCQGTYEQPTKPQMPLGYTPAPSPRPQKGHSGQENKHLANVTVLLGWLEIKNNSALCYS